FRVSEGLSDGLADGRWDLNTVYGGRPLAPVQEFATKFCFRRNKTKLLFAEHFREGIQSAEQPFVLNAPPKTVMALRNRWETLASSNLGGNLFFLNNAIDPWIITKYDCVLVTRLRLAATLLAIRCYWFDHGALPSRLDDLVPAYLPAVPIDEF